MVIQPTHFKVFLSHAEEDYSLVYRIWHILLRLYASPYVYERYPDYRQDLPTAIRDVLKNCTLCIPFLTKVSVGSQWVQQELGVAYAFGRIIIPVIEIGVEYKGFVQMVRKISYNPKDPDSMIFDVIYAVRSHFIGRGEIPILLTCANSHEHDYQLASTEDINKAIDTGHSLAFKCTTCGTDIKLNPRTLEITG